MGQMSNALLNPIVVLLALIGRMAFFCVTVLRAFVRRSPSWREVVKQSVRIGVNTVGILACILFFIGANLALVGHAIFKQFGAQDMLGIYVGLSTVIGLAPIIVGAVLAAKPGTEISATVASMRVKEQIDALEVMAVNPYWYLVVPRVLAHLLVTPGLLAVAIVSAIGGGFSASVYQLGLNPGVFMADVVRFLTVSDLYKGIVRAEVFALIVCMVSCFYGYYSAPGPAGVSRAINLAVVVGCTTLVLMNYVLTEWMY